MDFSKPSFCRIVMSGFLEGGYEVENHDYQQHDRPSVPTLTLTLMR